MGYHKVSNTKYKYKSVWLDIKCHKLRKRAFKLLNLFRKSNSTFIKELYLKANRLYKHTCELKRKVHYDNTILSLKHANNSKQFWSLLNTLKHKNKFLAPNCNSSELIEYFQSLLNPLTSNSVLSYAEPLINNYEFDKKITLDERK